MKTYKHNEELLSEECLAILHKNAKNIRIRKAEEERKAKRVELVGNIFFVATVVISNVLFYIGCLIYG